MAGWLKRPAARSAFVGRRGRIEAMLEGLPAPDDAEEIKEVEKELKTGSHFSLRHYIFELLRRFYGPFLWAPPAGDQGFEFLIGNWSAWLEAPIWYALFPFGIAGIFVLAPEALGRSVSLRRRRGALPRARRLLRDAPAAHVESPAAPDDLGDGGLAGSLAALAPEGSGLPGRGRPGACRGLLDVQAPPFDLSATSRKMAASFGAFAATE